MDSNSSSDEEDLEKFREAAVDFLCKKPSNTDENLELDAPNEVCRQPSLRPIKDDQEQFNLLDVTPGFQKFVAKRLGEYIENQLQKELANDIQYEHKKNQKTRGVKLFTNSKDFISLEEECSQKFNVKRVKIKKRTLETDDIDQGVKMRLCAVSSKDILNKKGTEFWTTYRQGEVYNYKRAKNGRLVYVEKKFK